MGGGEGLWEERRAEVKKKIMSVLVMFSFIGLMQCTNKVKWEVLSK